MDNALLELLELVKQSSPLVWESAMRQNTLYGIGNIILGGLLLVICLLLIRFLVRLYTAGYKYEAEVLAWESIPYNSRSNMSRPAKPNILQFKDEPTEWVVWIFTFITAIWSLSVLFNGVMYVTNPIYWTIKLLISNVK